MGSSSGMSDRLRCHRIEDVAVFIDSLNIKIIFKGEASEHHLGQNDTRRATKDPDTEMSLKISWML